MAPIKKLSATIFIRRSATRRCASASRSAPAKDSANEVRPRPAAVNGVAELGLAVGGPDASPRTEALCATTSSSMFPAIGVTTLVAEPLKRRYMPGQRHKPTCPRRSIEGV
ncbi:hypothetical protein MINTM008_48670 [Mycobacterium intracellulare]|uniref:Uncharacterized protein n=2 Tax=Mycobacterium avium complex (MAC) TaxID=120793 RepID=A0A7R7RP64_MYCIT|nr:hypothetical protein MPRI_12900 [Mycobacterium paraintracellulare]BCO48925.1 hypothetical protein MINTM002_45990 [Mycobacterium intracellulare]BCP39310.1 hypothetical protein MINTMi198_46800 [Mycobacterium intracellulare M.i.198]BCO43732.1 hypothetical protein MINTM001_48710 [Mycobacterium paraintracellulare]BCO54173.1 hypothetical protein MINTM003_46140 [Mycobacterium paraintracellulare]